ncbi:TonB family protein [Pedobacter aquatilis]|uniref:energy transducer TonB n=1 Tax=Pedobacter aquatilis TaxID=351343 RepID=UPI00292DE0C3|nr:TonB family protein [Pedobacter aquatilis]
MFNSSINVYKTEWLDIVFAGRNKNYGAYALRLQSSSILTRSLFIASSAFVLFFVSPMVYSKMFPEAEEVKTAPKVIDLKDVIHTMKKPEPEKKVEPEKAAPVKVKTVAVPSKIVVTNDAVLPPPTMNDMKDAVISSVTQDGEIKPNLVIATNPGNGNGETKGTETGTSTGNEVVDLPGVDEYPEFEGGMKAWAKYIQRNLKYPYQAQEAERQGKVFLSFVVEKDGSISNVTLVKGIGLGCDEEAIKVIRKSPAWKPGKNKGIPVRVRYNLPINFQLTN